MKNKKSKIYYDDPYGDYDEEDYDEEEYGEYDEDDEMYSNDDTLTSETLNS